MNSCTQHTEMAIDYMSWHSQADQFSKRGYRQRQCECGLFAIWQRPDKTGVASFYEEYRAWGKK